jgi:hypothetical protein
MQLWWESVEGNVLQQGDLLKSCLHPVSFGPRSSDPAEVNVDEDDLVIVSQSCDLVPGRNIEHVALCRVSLIEEVEANDPGKGANKWREQWNAVLKGRRQGFYLLQSPEEPDNNRKALLVDFRQIISLPCDYAMSHAKEFTSRWRLRPPQREHFSQAFGFYFMRVALPENLPDYK